MLTARETLPLVVRSLLKMRRVDLALELFQRHACERPESPEPTSACVLVQALCRIGKLDEANAMVTQLTLAHPMPSAAAEAAYDTAEDDDMEPMWHALGTSMVPTLALAHIERMEVEAALELGQRMAKAAPVCVPPLYILTKLMRTFARARCLPGVYACLDAQVGGQLTPDADASEALVQAMVRECRFVKGGVSMGTLPDDGLLEVAFIGRSNVGKSSMVNMALGRRAIAYTSKTPGKTQQYNYFQLNEPGMWQPRTANAGKVAEDCGDRGTFYLVDMPGLGYAKVPGAERRRWLSFLRQYAVERRELRLLVHLVDGLVGPQEVDLAVMRMVRDARADMLTTHADVESTVDAPRGSEHGMDAEAAEGTESGEAELPAGEPCGWEYAIVITKADKGGSKALKKVRAAVDRAISETGCPAPVGIIATSAKSKAGRPELWQLLRCVMLSDDTKGEHGSTEAGVPPDEDKDEI